MYDPPSSISLRFRLVSTVNTGHPFFEDSMVSISSGCLTPSKSWITSQRFLSNSKRRPFCLADNTQTPDLQIQVISVLQCRLLPSY